MNAVINQFVSRVNAAQKSRSKDVRLSIEEAQSLVVELNKLVTRDSSMVDQIAVLVKNAQLAQSSQTAVEIATPGTIVISGGRFTDSDE